MVVRADKSERSGVCKRVGLQRFRDKGGLDCRLQDGVERSKMQREQKSWSVNSRFESRDLPKSKLHIFRDKLAKYSKESCSTKLAPGTKYPSHADRDSAWIAGLAEASAHAKAAGADGGMVRAEIKAEFQNQRWIDLEDPRG